MAVGFTEAHALYFTHKRCEVTRGTVARVVGVRAAALARSVAKLRKGGFIADLLLESLRKAADGNMDAADDADFLLRGTILPRSNRLPEPLFSDYHPVATRGRKVVLLNRIDGEGWTPGEWLVKQQSGCATTPVDADGDPIKKPSIDSQLCSYLVEWKDNHMDVAGRFKGVEKLPSMAKFCRQVGVVVPDYGRTPRFREKYEELKRGYDRWAGKRG